MKIKFIKDSLLYIVSDAIFGGLPVILLPVFSYYLLPEEFALYTNVLILMGLFSVFIDFSAGGYYGVHFYSKERKKTRERLFVDSIRLMIINTLILGLVVAIFLDLITKTLTLDPIYVYASLFFGFFTSVNSLYLTKLRFYDKVILFVKLRLTQVVVHSILAVFFVVCLELSWVGRTLGHLLSILVIFPIFLFSEAKKINIIRLFKLSVGDLLAPFLFGLTLLPHMLSSWIKVGLDKALLSNANDFVANGIYSSAFQISVIISLIGIGFNKAFSPMLYKKINNEEYRSVKKIIIQFLLINTLVVVIAIFIFPFFIDLFLSEKYVRAVSIMPHVLIAQGFLNIYMIFSNILFQIKKTLVLSFISVFSAMIHVFFLFLLIGRFSELGVAISFLLSALIQTLLTVVFVYRKTPYIWK